MSNLKETIYRDLAGAQPGSKAASRILELEAENSELRGQMQLLVDEYAALYQASLESAWSSRDRERQLYRRARALVVNRDVIRSRRNRWRARHRDAYHKLWKVREAAEAFRDAELFASPEVGEALVRGVSFLIDDHRERFLSERRRRKTG